MGHNPYPPIRDENDMANAVRQLKESLQNLNTADPEQSCPYGCQDGVIYGEAKHLRGKIFELRADIDYCPLHARGRIDS